MQILNMIAFGVVLCVGMYALTWVMMRKQQPQRPTQQPDPKSWV